MILLYPSALVVYQSRPIKSGTSCSRSGSVQSVEDGTAFFTFVN